MWNVEPLIFDDEDEEALKARFIELSAKYPDRTAYEIADYVFKYQRDKELRSKQAGDIWSRDLDVLERIDNYKRFGASNNNEIASKIEKLKVLESIYNNLDTKPMERIKAIELHAQIQGEIVKAIDKSVNERGLRRPVHMHHNIDPRLIDNV